MHLVTGMLLTALLGGKSRRAGVRLPSFPGILEPEHVLPGRVRLRVPSLVGRPELAAGVEKRLRPLDGMRQVEARSRTGSLLLRFDTGRVEPEVLVAAVIRLLGLEGQIEKAPRSRIRRGLHDWGEALNRAVHEHSGGLIDLWTGLPLLLAVVGVRNIVLRNGGLGWPLLWWAYMSLFPSGRDGS